MHLGMTAASGSHMRHPSPTYRPPLTESKRLSSPSRLLQISDCYFAYCKSY
ncbi:hypothetical protein HanRHA438_Chr09g0403751 [Helianthus annuus]|uniref:Uncharacterized protein n=1 Tax=Helianthus annuus TaxID=4232 RepID=A0A9K3N905_HELAN|nr:hypothetical protein HanXRQr2_Chr09g0392051 [Helianthus annuus]KAJ0888598.1 hypothetical protein HanRHA438_Chr09g0403751 [Helianthus annuus]KAJ0893476.1 hypothetical protein HanPSC8_Chr09g0378021 [Helianthus annuus]